jgi:hypothetical protein
MELLSDAIQRYAPGAIPATMGGLAGYAAGWLQEHGRDLYQDIKGSVPH